MAADPITAVFNVGEKLITRLWPDPEQQDKARLAMLELAQRGELAELTESASIIREEAKSEGVLTRNWRPIVMLTFTGLVVAHWFGYTAPNLPPEQAVRLLDIVELGLGGYVIGRSAEKVVEKAMPVAKGWMESRK